MKYPDDFKPFEGKKLSEEEINALIQETIDIAKSAEPSEFNDLLASSRTGDTKIEVSEYGYVIVWQQVADHWEKE